MPNIIHILAVAALSGIVLIFVDTISKWKETPSWKILIGGLLLGILSACILILSK